jgi:hypothetical protein
MTRELQSESPSHAYEDQVPISTVPASPRPPVSQDNIHNF